MQSVIGKCCICLLSDKVLTAGIQCVQCEQWLVDRDSQQLDFGTKNCGKTFKEIADFDKGFCRWFLKKKKNNNSLWGSDFLKYLNSYSYYNADLVKRIDKIANQQSNEPVSAQINGSGNSQINGSGNSQINVQINGSNNISMPITVIANEQSKQQGTKSKKQPINNCIYFIDFGDNVIKIGKTKHLASRIKQYNTHNPNGIKILLILYTDKYNQLERDIQGIAKYKFAAIPQLNIETYKFTELDPFITDAVLFAFNVDPMLRIEVHTYQGTLPQLPIESSNQQISLEQQLSNPEQSKTQSSNSQSSKLESLETQLNKLVLLEPNLN